VQGQQLVRTYTFTNNENCNVPDGSALSYEDIETLTEISLDNLKKIRVLEGNIFFAGQGFRRSVLMEYAKCGKKIFETDSEFNSYKKIITGTKVIFKACVFLNADGTMTSKKTKVLIINNG
jgi:hypothetical protein